MFSIVVKLDEAKAEPNAPRRIAIGAATAIGRVIKARAKAGKAPEQPKNTAPNLRKIVPEQYTSEGEQTNQPGGRYVLTEELRRNPGTGNVSGGMWSGLRAKGDGALATLAFEGSSVGANPNFGKVISSQLVTNALKAETVLEAQDVNVLKMSDADRAAMQDAHDTLVAKVASKAMQGRIRWIGGPPSARTELGRAILRASQ